MNQRGEITIASCLLILAFSSLVILSALELKRSFRQLEKRTKLFLCAKETKGELHVFMKFMGRTNWAIRNTNRASLIMVFIPGLQGAAMDAQKLKKALQYAQEARLVSFLKTLRDLKGRGCPLDPRMFITPFELGSRLLARDNEGAANLRKKTWTYYFLLKPYALAIETRSDDWEAVQPRITYLTSEKGAMLSSLSSSQW
jgi:hypothetical protein